MLTAGTCAGLDVRQSILVSTLSTLDTYTFLSTKRNVQTYRALVENGTTAILLLTGLPWLNNNIIIIIIP